MDPGQAVENMVERGGWKPRPGGEKFDAGSRQGRSTPGGEAGQFIHNLIEQRGLQGGDPYDPFYLMEDMTRHEGGTYSEGIANTARVANIPVELSQTIHNVWIAYGLAVYNDPRLERW
jgi:hypothetical protein